MKNIVFLLAPALALLCALANSVPLGGDLKGRTELVKQLFENYDPEIIPDNVTAKMAISLQHLDLKLEDNVLETGIHLIQCWTDSRLAWDNTTNGINVLHLSPSKIWKPDIVLYNSADYKNEQNCQEASKVIVFPTGYTLWVAACEMRSRCNFTSPEGCGEQKCQLKFSSWVYDKELLDLDLVTEDQGINIDEFGSLKWKVVETSAERKERTFGGYPNAYADVTFNLTMSKIDSKDCA